TEETDGLRATEQWSTGEARAAFTAQGIQDGVVQMRDVRSVIRGPECKSRIRYSLVTHPAAPVYCSGPLLSRLQNETSSSLLLDSGGTRNSAQTHLEQCVT
ncbi:unnamed protein product, partial [Rangifer tarandus platyrhynchus]